MTRSRTLRKILKILMVLFIVIIGIMVLLFPLVNLPVSKRLITNKVNRVFENAGLPLKIHAIHTVLPRQLDLEGFSIQGIENDSVVYVGEISAGFHPKELLRSRVLLHDLHISQVIVDLSRMDPDDDLNIAEVFKPPDKIPKKELQNKKTSWEIVVRNAELKGIDFAMNDHPSGIFISQNIGSLSFDRFILSLEDRTIKAQALELIQSEGDFRMEPAIEKSEKSPGAPWSFEMGRAKMQKVNFVYDDRIDSLLIETNLTEGLIRMRRTDIAGKQIDVEKVRLTGTDVNVFSGSPSAVTDTSEKNQKNTSVPEIAWDITGNSIELTDNNVRFYHYPSGSEIPDTSIMGISGLNMDLSGIRLSPASVNASLRNLQFNLNDGFQLENLKAELDSDEKLTRLDLNLETRNSQIGLKAEAGTPVWQILSDPASMDRASIKMNRTEISTEDILSLMKEPGGNAALNFVSGQALVLHGDIGYRDSLLQINQISLSQDKRFEFHLTGTAIQPFYPDRASGEMQFGLEVLDEDWLKEELTALGIEDSFPETGAFSITGTASGPFSSPEWAVDVQSILGKAGITGFIDTRQQRYDLRAYLESTMIGDLFTIPDLGRVKGSGQLSGSGFDADMMDAVFDFNFDTIVYRTYPYAETTVQGNLQKGATEFEVSFKDPSISGNLNGHLSATADTMLEFISTGYLKAALHDLHFYHDTLSVESNLTALFNKTGNKLESELWLTGVQVENSWDQVELDTVYASFRTDTSETDLALASDFVQLTTRLGLPLDSMGTLGPSYLNYFRSMTDTVQDTGSIRVKYLPELSIRGSVVYDDLIPMFIGDSTLIFSNIEIALHNNANNQWIDYQFIGDNLYYKGISTGNLTVHLSDSSGFLDIQADALNNRIIDTPARQITMNSRISDQGGQSAVSMIDRNGTRLFHFDLSSRIEDSMMMISSPSKEMILNGNPWQLVEPDMLAVNLHSGDIYPSLEIRQESSRIGFHSDQENGGTRYEFSLNKLNIESVLPNGIISGNPEGSITGQFYYDREENRTSHLDAEVEIDSIRWSGLEFDRIDVDAGMDDKENGNLELNLTALMDSARVTLLGELADSALQNLQVRIQSLPINTFQPFVKKYLSRMRGLVSGEFMLAQGINKREVKGELNILDAHLKVIPLNAAFRISDDRISFDGRRMILNDFTVLDSLGNNLKLNGYVDVRSEEAINTDLQVSASQLHVMNKEDDGVASLYGNVIIDSRMSMKGPLNNPVIKGNVHLAEGSDIYYRYVEDLSISESEKIITFVDHSPGGGQQRPTAELNIIPFQRKSIETSVDIDPATGIHFNISQMVYNIDLNIRGGGSLGYQMKGNNQNSLVGSYEIRDGTADVKMVGWPSKRFRLTSGGFVRWDGVLNNPDVKLEAINSVRSTYMNPVDGKQREIDFNVVLQLTNRLSELEVLFLLNTPDQYVMSVINTLSPEEQLRQAISVLLFERVDLPGISTTSNYMTEQVNQLVASQLNQLTRASIKGVDISLGIDSYTQATEGGGEEMTTSLSYEVRKEFMDERANIEVSGRLNDLYSQPGASDFTLNNISFEYRLDSSGTKFIKVYNQHEYEDVFEGEVISTGIGITFRKRYSKVGDIWRRDPEHKKNKIGQ
jgi:hypothetical protein